jgi:hypothetical protein
MAVAGVEGAVRGWLNEDRFSGGKSVETVKKSSP